MSNRVKYVIETTGGQNQKRSLNLGIPRSSMTSKRMVSVEKLGRNYTVGHLSSGRWVPGPTELKTCKVYCQRQASYHLCESLAHLWTQILHVLTCPQFAKRWWLPQSYESYLRLSVTASFCSLAYMSASDVGADTFSAFSHISVAYRKIG